MKGLIILDNLEKINETLFEDIKHIDEYGNEYWFARELMLVLEYDKWNNFHSVIKHAQKAKINAEASKINDFTEVGKIVQTGALSRKIIDYRLSRYACYLIAMNGDTRKKAIALAQTYFAVKTRQQELSENFEQLTEDQKRLGIRQELAKHNSSLSEAAHNAGITSPAQYATFQNAGYRGLYGGLTENDIHKRKNLKPTQKILDHMGSTELAANLFRATQTDEKLRRDNIHGVTKANNTHYEVGAKVRQTIQELGGTMPENLPTPEKSIQQLKSEEKKKAKEIDSNMQSLFE